MVPLNRCMPLLHSLCAINNELGCCTAECAERVRMMRGDAGAHVLIDAGAAPSTHSEKNERPQQYKHQKQTTGYMRTGIKCVHEYLHIPGILRTPLL